MTKLAINGGKPVYEGHFPSWPIWDEKEEKKDKEEKKPEPTPTPNTKKVGKTPYSNSYEKVSIDYVSSSEGISFQTTTFDGETVSESLFAKNGITMVNIWTQA